MNAIKALFLKDVVYYLTRPQIYLIFGICCLVWSPLFTYIFGVFLSESMGVMAPGQLPVNFSERVLAEHVNIVHFMTLFFICVLSMHSLAAERQNGTLTALLTAPGSRIYLVLGKFFAQSTIVFLLLFLSSLYVFSVMPLGPVALPLVLTSYFGLFLIAELYVSVGLFASVYSANVVVTFFLTLVSCLSFWFLGLGVELFDSLWAKDIFTALDIGFVYRSFVKGIVRWQSVLTLLSLSGLFLFAAHKMLDWLAWRR